MRQCRNSWMLAAALVLLLALTAPTSALDTTQFLGPSPYLQWEDSPFAGLSFSYFHLEDFEDRSLNTPGVSASAGNPYPFTEAYRAYTDSVDADNGVLDGSGTSGYSFFYDYGDIGITFSFDDAVLGGLPTHVGIVWTDGCGLLPDGTAPAKFEAFDAAGVSLGAPTTAYLGDNSFLGGTAEDRFFGVIHSGGVSSIHISDGGCGFEVDHLQYGRANQPVEIDIKPGSDPNCFNNNGHGVIPVAILTTETFDAATVDPLSVTLDGAGVRVKGKSGNAGSLEDVDNDGDLDLVVHIEDMDGIYQEGDSIATLIGVTSDGIIEIMGTGTICIVP